MTNAEKLKVDFYKNVLERSVLKQFKFSAKNK